MNTLRFLPLALALAACASQPEVAPTPAPQPVVAALVPAGSYEFETSVQGQPVTGTMTITAASGGYGGRIATSMFPDIPVTGATVDGQSMIVQGNMEGGELLLKLKFDGAKFTGTWELGTDGGDIIGRKL